MHIRFLHLLGWTFQIHSSLTLGRRFPACLKTAKKAEENRLKTEILRDFKRNPALLFNFLPLNLILWA